MQTTVLLFAVAVWWSPWTKAEEVGREVGEYEEFTLDRDQINFLYLFNKTAEGRVRGFNIQVFLVGRLTIRQL